MDWYWRFLKKYGFAGLLLSLLAIAFVFFVLLFAGIGPDRFNHVFRLMTVPADLSIAVRQPWTLLSYWFVVHPFAFWQVIVDMLILYTFGHILNAMIGDQRMQGIVIFTILVNALVTIGFANLLPTISISNDLRLSGFDTINASIIAAAITLVPKYNFRIIIWDVPLVAVGGFLLLVSAVSQMVFFTLGGLSVFVGAATGSLLIVALRRGFDPTKWLQFRFSRKKASPAETRQAQTERVMAEHRIQQKTETQKITVKPGSGRAKPVLSEAEELDFLLDKISEVGYNGLTRTEKERLDKLSGK